MKKILLLLLILGCYPQNPLLLAHNNKQKDIKDLSILAAKAKSETDLAQELFNNLNSSYSLTTNEINEAIAYTLKAAIKFDFNRRKLLVACLNIVSNKIRKYNMLLCGASLATGISIWGSLHILNYYTPSLKKERVNQVKNELKSLGAINIQYKETNDPAPIRYTDIFGMTREIPGIRSPNFQYRTQTASAQCTNQKNYPLIKPLLSKLIKAHDLSGFEELCNFGALGTIVSSAGLFFSFIKKNLYMYRQLYTIQKELKKRIT